MAAAGDGLLRTLGQRNVPHLLEMPYPRYSLQRFCSSYPAVWSHILSSLSVSYCVDRSNIKGAHIPEAMPAKQIDVGLRGK